MTEKINYISDVMSEEDCKIIEWINDQRKKNNQIIQDTE